MTTIGDTRLEYFPALGRRVRLGSWEDQKISTYRKISEAVEQGRWDDAAELCNYFVDEAKVCFAIYRQWIPDLSAFLAENGVSRQELQTVHAEIVAKLDLPGGRPWDPFRQWHEFVMQVEEFVALVHREESAAALEQLDALKETWRRCHDRDVDHTYGLMSEIVKRLGEESIGAMWDKVLLPLFTWRYEKFDIDKFAWEEGLETLMLVACEAMRGHLVGPERTGDFELIETEDRYILRFDPCGSGGRTIRGDWIEGTPARMEPPYNWTVSQEEHTWNHNTKGVCHYCTHCIRLMEELPMDRFGYPVRVIDPPTYPDTNPDPNVRQKCQWQMFKDPTQVPEEYYERVGRKRPEAFGSKALGAPELPPPMSGMPGAG
ncbi:MAG TPA: hypothetical protein VG073_09295 [Gaiellaceae bacterium]|jgi:hypothetical protein|nr:hypothetical protein [Gaiellaceae bacterium]